jgi:hypothetical protein
MMGRFLPFRSHVNGFGAVWFASAHDTVWRRAGVYLHSRYLQAAALGINPALSTPLAAAV